MQDIAPKHAAVLSERPRTITECDQKIARELFDPLCRILFRAWQIHQRDAVEQAWETAPPAVRVLVHTAAGEAVAAVSAPPAAPAPSADPRLALLACARCGNPLLTAQERTSMHCDTCVQEYLVRR